MHCDFDHSERAESGMENEDSDPSQEFNIPAKRPKEDCFNSDIFDWDFTEPPATANLMDSDEEFAVELQKQFLGESSSQGPFETSISSNFVNQTVAINDASGSHGIIGPHVYSIITEVVQALEKSVNKEEQFFITLR